MAIPWLIGGAAVAVAGVVAAAMSDNDSSSGSYSRDVRDEERRLERERKRQETLARKKELQTYVDRVTKNLAKKYAGSDSEHLHKELSEILGTASRVQSYIWPIGQTVSASLYQLKQNEPVEKLLPLLNSTAEFQEHQRLASYLQEELAELEEAMALLEVLNDEFK